MAVRNFVTKTIELVKSESEWLSSTYQILPNEQVLAICNKTVTENEENKTYVYIRSKVNTTSTSKLFSELEYSDQYIEVQINDSVAELGETITTQLNTISGRVASVESKASGIEQDVNDIAEQLPTMNTAINKNKTDIASLNTEIEEIGQTNMTLLNSLKTELEGKIDQALTSTYKPMGSIDSITSLPTANSEHLGEVYNISSAFDTTSDFMEGAGKHIEADANVAIVDDGTGGYKYDVIGSVVDLTNYYDKDQVDAKIDAVNDVIDSKIGDIDLSQVETNTSNITALSGRVSDAETHISGVEGDISEVQGTLATINTNVGKKANIASPEFTGVPKAPTAGKGTNTTQIATTEFVATATADITTNKNNITGLSTRMGVVEQDLTGVHSDISGLETQIGAKWSAVDATTTTKGIVQLNDAVNSTSTTQAATANAVKTAYDLANGKWTSQTATTSRSGIVQLNNTVTSTSTTQAATANAVKTAYDAAMAAGGASVVLSASQPTGQKSGDLWFKTL